MNFERLKWGGVRHDKVVYAWFDLTTFRKEEVPKATPEDIEIFRQMVAAIAAAPKTTTSDRLQAQFPKELKSNKDERDVIVAILGYCGILATPEYPGYSDAFIPAGERELPSRRFVDMPYPACWWRADIGLSQEKLNEYFGHVL